MERRWAHGLGVITECSDRAANGKKWSIGVNDMGGLERLALSSYGLFVQNQCGNRIETTIIIQCVQPPLDRRARPHRRPFQEDSAAIT